MYEQILIFIEKLFSKYQIAVFFIWRSLQVLRKACIKCGQCFLHFFICSIPSIIDLISCSFECLMAYQSHTFHSSSFTFHCFTLQVKISFISVFTENLSPLYHPLAKNVPPFNLALTLPTRGMVPCPLTPSGKP